MGGIWENRKTFGSLSLCPPPYNKKGGQSETLLNTCPKYQRF